MVLFEFLNIHGPFNFSSIIFPVIIELSSYLYFAIFFSIGSYIISNGFTFFKNKPRISDDSNNVIILLSYKLNIVFENVLFDFLLLSLFIYNFFF